MGPWLSGIFLFRERSRKRGVRAGKEDLGLSADSSIILLLRKYDFQFLDYFPFALMNGKL